MIWLTIGDGEPTGASSPASAASLAKALPSSAVHELSSVPAGTSCESMYGAAAGAASDWANDSPESSISHTLVTGFSAVLGVLVGAECEGPGDVSVSAAAGDVEAPELTRARLWRCRRRLRGAASSTAPAASLAAGGVGTDAEPAGAARPSKVASSPGSSVRAKDDCGAGPIAAPIATPPPSVPAAAAAVTRLEGRRRTPSRAGGGGDPSGAGGVGFGEPWLDALSVVLMLGGLSLAKRTRPARRPIFDRSPGQPTILINFPIQTQFIEIMLFSAGIGVNESTMAPSTSRYRRASRQATQVLNTTERSDRLMTSTRRVLTALTVAGVLGAAAPAAASAATITMSGATASYPLVSLLAQKYAKTHKRLKVKFRIAQGGAQVGINDVSAGRVTIANVSRDPLPSDPAGLDFYPIAKYAICVVTNKSNTLGNLTLSQLVSIFTGKIRSWSQVSGASASGTIDLESRTSVAGVLTSFQTLLLEGKKVSSVASEQGSEGLMRQAVEGDPNSIGFISNYQSDKGGVHVVSIAGVGCSRATAVSGQYPGIARFYEVTKGRATGAAAAFINWVAKNSAAKKIINTQWISF
jgi:phosphate transport system substrate-binding protein